MCCKLLQPQVQPAPEGVVVAAKHNVCGQQQQQKDRQLICSAVTKCNGNSKTRAGDMSGYHYRPGVETSAHTQHHSCLTVSSCCPTVGKLAPVQSSCQHLVLPV